MDKCKQNKQIKMDTEMDMVIDFLKVKYSKYLESKEGFVYKEIDSDGNCYCVDLCRTIILRTSKERTRKFIASKENIKVYTIKNIKIIIKTPKDFQAQGLLSNIMAWKDIILTTIQGIKEKVNFISTTVDNLSHGSVEISLWLIDCMALLSELADPYAYGIKRMLTMLARLYTLVQRLRLGYNAQRMEAQSFVFTQVGDVILAFTALGAPKVVLDKIKDFSILTGGRVTDTTWFITTFCTLVEFLYSFLEWINDKKYVDITFVLNSLKGIKDYASNFRLIKEVMKSYNAFTKNQQIIIDVEFREKVLDLAKQCMESSFQEYVNNDNNKFFKPVYKAFVDVVVKYTKTFDVSSKQEPICFVFSGPPGCGKSVLMNAFVDYLRNSKSVYVHTTPALTAGKDFYDDYLNQEVFVMDDVGQQSASQWRHIINFVSPVKYPLECATAELKNTKFFVSKLILCTTNAFEDLRFTTTDGIACKEALFRRVHLFNCTKESMYYKKFDFENPNQHWESSWIEPYKNFMGDLPTELHVGRDLREKVTYLAKVLGRLERCRENEANVVRLCEDQLNAIKEDVETFMQGDKATRNEAFFDAEGVAPSAARKVAEVSETVMDIVEEAGFWRAWANGIEVLGEFSRAVVSRLKESVQSIFTYISSSFIGNIVQGIRGYPALVHILTFTAVQAMVVLSIGAILRYFDIDEQEIQDRKVDEIIESWRRTRETAGNNFKGTWWSQGDSTIVSAVQSNYRFVMINTVVNGNEVQGYCQGLVSGNKILLPDHMVGDNTSVKVYRNWEAYNRKEIELDEQPLDILYRDPLYDVVVARFRGVHMSVYRLAKSAFSDGCVSTEDLRLVNCGFDIVLSQVGGYSANSEKISVRSVKGSIEFAERTGLVYGISSKGLCGSGLISKSQGIVGMHNAGNEKSGFAVLWPTSVRNRIKEELVDTQKESRFEVAEIGREFSGMRLKYKSGDIITNYPATETTYVPTKLHFANNEKMQNVMQEHKLKAKGPPNFKSLGTSRDTMQKLSEKSFMPVGKVDREELSFAEKIIDDMLEDFGDMTLEDAVFGEKGKDNFSLGKLNMDSSNGYGWTLGKEDVFDCETRSVAKEFMDVYKEFEDQCKSGDLDVKHVMARETFKDELRAEKKIDIPRTFRVLPLQHIVATKVCLGNMMKHVRKNMWKNGIAIGLNPYKDWHKIYSRLQTCDILCDIDFGKWDGKLHPAMQDMITRVVMRKYKGEHRELLQVILDSIVRGFVLVADKVYMTTHSLPSGTWVTALFNSLINKALSAMTLYRGCKREGWDMEFTVLHRAYYQLVDWAMGDDKLCGTPKPLRKVFNALLIQEVAEDLGLECTDGNKNKIVGVHTPITDLVFLKRHFAFNAEVGRVMCPLSLETIVNTLQWVDKKKDIEVVMNGKCMAVQIEGLLYGESFSNKLFDIVREHYPLTVKMDKEDILRIFEEEDGYAGVMAMLGKYDGRM